MKTMDYFEKLAALSEELPVENDPTAIPSEEAGQMPVEEEPLTKEEAIDEAAMNATAVAEAAVGDGAPAPVVPDAPIEGDPALEEQELLENLMLEREQLASYVEENLVGFGTLARLYEVGHDESVEEGLRKSASTYLDEMLTDEESFSAGLDKMAGQLFGDQQDVETLFTDDGIDYVVGHLASFHDGALEKVASDLGDMADGNSIVNKTKQAVGGFVESVQRLKGINQEITTLQSKIDEAKDIHSQLATSGMTADGVEASLGNLNGLKAQQAEAINFRAKGYGLAGLGAGALAGGAYLAGRHFGNQETQEVDPPMGGNGATLDAGNQHMLSENGGTYKMANTEQNVYLDNILKLAGAHFLIDGSTNEAYGMEFNKQASDAFDSIASMSRADMDVAFAKIALENYGEDTLREIVAGTYTEEILEKTASIAAWDDLSADELVKIAGAGSVSAKGAAGALRDASEKVKNEIAIAKAQTEGQGRQYAGDADQSGKLGGGLVGGLEGYNVINNPGAYEVAKTASQEDIEAAVMLKQAAYESYVEAEQFLKNAFGQ